MQIYSIVYTEEALADLQYFRKPERQLILEEIDLQLTYEPTVGTKNRKQLRPNQLGEWELRVGKYRIFYDIIEQDGTEVVRIVKIEAAGYKEHNKLFIRGKEFKL